MYITFAANLQEEIVMSKANNTQIAASLREMAAVGIPVDLSVAEFQVEIELVGEAHENIIFDLPDGRAGCIIDLSSSIKHRNPFGFAMSNSDRLGQILSLNGFRIPRRRGAIRSTTIFRARRRSCPVSRSSSIFCWTGGS
jgi:hypothetical protein